MAKLKTTYVCQSCGSTAAKWMGKCSSCGEWNTYVEEVVEKKSNGLGEQTRARSFNPQDATIQKISEVDYSRLPRIVTKDDELNRVLGGGIVPGSLILVGGEPGIGKSTLMLQLALQLDARRILYVSGEESPEQIKMRANRIDEKSNDCEILAETNTQKIFRLLVDDPPSILIVDSIQTVHTDWVESAAGSISQIRECTHELQKFAKQTGTVVIIIGHINKDGAIAGPKILEHIVDTVLQFEGDRHNTYRLLRTIKNRFGSTSELGIYEMLSSGLRQVKNPSELLLSDREEKLSGIAIGATIEGARPMLIETQALVSPSAYGTPQRSATGFDLRRLNMILAVLEKRGGMQIGNRDVFLNITGGLKVEDPASDLAVVCALLSSYMDEPVDDKCCFAAEVGLSGEVRAVNRLEQRIAEAEKLGFETIYVSKYAKLSVEPKKIKVERVAKVEEVYRQLFKGSNVKA